MCASRELFSGAHTILKSSRVALDKSAINNTRRAKRKRRHNALEDFQKPGYTRSRFCKDRRFLRPTNRKRPHIFDDEKSRIEIIYTTRVAYYTSAIVQNVREVTAGKKLRSPRTGVCSWLTVRPETFGRKLTRNDSRLRFCNIARWKRVRDSFHNYSAVNWIKNGNTFKWIDPRRSRLVGF